MNLDKLINTRYLGDGVYVGKYNYEMWLITHDEVKTTNAICLEPEVVLNLVEYLKNDQRNSENNSNS